MSVARRIEHRPFQPAAGVASDFERLVTKFAETGSVRYDQFSSVWREMKLSYIYAGRNADRELKEFIEECYAVAVKLFLPPYVFQTRVGGLYILYALYHTQPYFPKVKIRMTYDQWLEALVFHDFVKSQQHYDISFVFVRLRMDGAFHFVATSSELHPFLPDTTCELPVVTASSMSEVLPPDVTEQLSAIHDQYWRMKCALAGPSSEQPDSSLDVVDSGFVDQVTSSLKECEETMRPGTYDGEHTQSSKTTQRKKNASGHGDNEGSEDGESAGERPNGRDKSKSASSRAAAIKSKAFSRVAPTDYWRSRSLANDSVHPRPAADNNVCKSPPMPSKESANVVNTGRKRRRGVIGGNKQTSPKHRARNRLPLLESTDGVVSELIPHEKKKACGAENEVLQTSSCGAQAVSHQLSKTAEAASKKSSSTDKTAQQKKKAKEKRKRVDHTSDKKHDCEDEDVPNAAICVSPHRQACLDMPYLL